MKHTIEQITSGEDEVIVRYRQLTAEVERIIAFIEQPQKLTGMRNGARVIIDTQQILYIESVEGRTFVYLPQDTVEVEHSLAQLEDILTAVNFFRCSKSMIINIDRVTELRSLASNRIDATMQGGEHIIISRTYASDFRKILKGGRRNG